MRFHQATLVDDVLLEGSTLWTQSATIDRVIGITFDVDYLRHRVLRFVAERMNDHAAAYGTVGTRTTRLSCTLDLQSLRLRVNRRKAEAEHTYSRTSDHGGLDEGSSGDIHRTYLRTSAWLSVEGTIEGVWRKTRPIFDKSQRSFGLFVMLSEADEVKFYFCIPVFARPEVERGSVDLVDEWNSEAEASEIDSFKVVFARIARFDSDVIELG